MASLIFNSFWDDLARGNIDLDADTIYVMLCTDAYAPNKDTHTKRSDVTNEITATGYTAGGKACTVTVEKNTSDDRLIITLNAVSWSGFTGISRQAVYYKRRGGASSADELVAVNDFGADVNLSGTTMAIANSVITVQN